MPPVPSAGISDLTFLQTHSFMKHSLRLIGAALLLLIIGTGTAGAQYYQIANQIPGLLQPALSGGLNYKGYVDGSYVVGMGNRRADFLELTTTQGFRYSSWFFMGVGAGVQVMFSDSNHPERPSWPADGFDPDRGTTRTACMIPLYTDFRFNIGGDQKDVTFFIDLRVGGSFLIGNDYIEIGDGYLTNSGCFYLKPAMGLRIPLNESGKQAINVGVSYQFLTSNYYRSYASNCSLNALGVTIGFDW